jgi:hypothetical protein
MDARATLAALVLACGILALCGRRALAEVAGLRVTNDRGLDTSSIPRIVEQVVKPGMTDQEKAVALWRFACDYNFFWPAPYEPPREDFFAYGVVFDPLKLLNVYGYAYCFQHRSIVEALWEEAGLEARTDGIAGHCIAEVFYDGQYHYLDSSQKCYCLLPDGQTIASRDQVADNPLDLMVYQARPSDPYLPGSAHALLTFEDRHLLAGLFFYHDFYAQHHLVRGSHSMNLTVPTASRLTWHWQGVGKWRQRTPADLDYELKNMAHYNPYDGPFQRGAAQAAAAQTAQPGAGVPRPGGGATYSNVVFRLHPDLAAPEELNEVLVGSANVAVKDRALATVTKGAGHADLRVRLPYVICGWPTVLEPNGKPSGAAVVSGRAVLGAGGALRLLVSVDEGVSWTEVWRTDQPGTSDISVDLSTWLDGRYAFRLRFAFDGPAGAVRVTDLALDVNTQAAQMPLPALKPGPNRITLDLGDQTEVMEFFPELKTQEDLLRYAIEVKDLRMSKYYIEPPSGGTGEATFRVTAPAGRELAWLLVGGIMRTSNPAHPDEFIEIAVSAGVPTDFKTVWTSDVPPEIEHWQYEVDHRVDLPAGTREAFVRYRLNRLDEGALGVPRIVAHYRRPQPATLPDGVRLTYAWRENGRSKTHEQVVTTFPFTYTIDVPADATVEMDTLTLAPERPNRAAIGDAAPAFTQPPPLTRRDFSDHALIADLRGALIRIREQPELDTFIDIFRTSKHTLLRSQTLPVIAMVGLKSDPVRAEKALAEFKRDPDKDLAEKAGKTLDRFYALQSDDVQVTALRDPRAGRRAIAAAVLGLRRVTTARDVLAPLLGDESESVRRAAALALARLGDDRAVPVLVAQMGQAGTPVPTTKPDERPPTERELRAAQIPCAIALCALGDRRGADLVEQVLASPDRYHRYAVIDGLGDVAGAKAEAYLLRAVADPWPYVRRAAITWLARFGGQAALDAIRRQAKAEPVVWVRSEIAHAARRIQSRLDAVKPKG